MYARYTARSDAGAREAGSSSTAHELAPTSTATTVRVRDGETIVTDGPFAETKEALGGYFLFDCDTLDEALDARRADPGGGARRGRGPARLRRRGGRAGARVAGGRGMKYVLLLNNAQEDRRALGADVEEEAQTRARGGDPEVERALRGARPD